MEEEMTAADEMAKSKGIPPYQAEMAVIEADHADIGSRLVNNWKLPDLLVGGVRGHHDLSKCANDEQKLLAALLNAADTIANLAHLTSAESVVPTEIAESWEILEINGEHIPKILDGFLASLPEVEELSEAMS